MNLYLRVVANNNLEQRYRWLNLNLDRGDIVRLATPTTMSRNPSRVPSVAPSAKSAHPTGELGRRDIIVSMREPEQSHHLAP